jgi:hypothetical protein
LIGVLALLPLFTAHPLQAATPFQEFGPSGYTYAECNRLDEAAVQAEMETIALGPLTKASAGLDIEGLVARKWTELGVGVALDQEVDAAITRFQQEKSYWERFVSGWSAANAEALAGEVASDAFDGPVFQAKLDELAAALAEGLVAELEAHAARSASSALLCLQSYVHERYSETLFTAFHNRIRQEIAPAVTSEEDVTGVTISPADLHLKALGGLGVIGLTIATQVTRKIAVSLSQKIAGRLAGKIAGRVLGRLGSSVIPYVGWVVGAGLIVWDLVEGAQGALPQIREVLQADEVKQEVRAEIASAVRAGLKTEVQTLAATLAGTLVGQWQSFCAEQGDLCALAAANDDFRALLNTMPVEQLPRLTQQLTVYLIDLDWAQRTASLADGSFEALLALPESAYTVLGRTHDPHTVLAWAELAGPAFEEMVARELYTLVAPEQLSPATFSLLVVIENNDIIHKLLALAPEHLETLAQLAPAVVQTIATNNSVDKLDKLANHLSQQPAEEVQRIGAQLASGVLTIDELLEPAPAQLNDTAQPNADTEPGYPVSVVPAPPWKPVTWWETSPWSSIVLLAAVLVMALLVAFGAIELLRRDSTGSPS